MYKLDLLIDAVHVREDSNIGVLVSLDHVLGGLTSEFAELAQLRNVHLGVMTHRHSVLSHPVLLSGILRNLIRNAIHIRRPVAG